MSDTPPSFLELPLYGASPKQAVKRFYKKYATFTGRASRSEYWWVALFHFAVFGVLYSLVIFSAFMASTVAQGGGDPSAALAPFMSLGPLIFLVGAANFVPTLALSVRRLHDANLSGLLLLLALVPGLGGFIVLVFAILPSDPLGVRFDGGTVPHGYYAPPQSQTEGPGQPS